jgi:hypothetical protein
MGGTCLRRKHPMVPGNRSRYPESGQAGFLTARTHAGELVAVSGMGTSGPIITSATAAAFASSHGRRFRAAAWRDTLELASTRLRCSWKTSRFHHVLEPPKTLTRTKSMAPKPGIRHPTLAVTAFPAGQRVLICLARRRFAGPHHRGDAPSGARFPWNQRQNSLKLAS